MSFFDMLFALLPSRSQIVDVGMDVYKFWFYLVFFISAVVIGMIVWHLVPRKEY